MCTICDLIKKLNEPNNPFLYADADIAVIHSMDTNVLGYFILTTKRHAENPWDLTKQESEKIGYFTKLLSDFIRQTFADVEKVYICSFNEETHHVHYHIFPRYSWMLELEGTTTNQKTDAVKIFDKVREIYKGPLSEETRQTVSSLKQIFNQFLCKIT